MAGTTVEEAVAAAVELNRQRIEVSLDSLGESVTDVAQAEASAAIYHQLLDEIASRGLRANVSLKLTQMGMEIGRPALSTATHGPALAERIVREIVEHAHRTQNFVRLDMEGSEYTEATIAMTKRLHAAFPGAVGTVLQAYLFRTESDTERLLGQGIRIRLCKGAYKEPPEIAFAAKTDVDANYAKLMERMVTSGVFCGIATHDEALVERLCRFVEARGLAKSAFEFQMLYGIRRDLQRRLVRDGYGVRVYVPFGTEWYPYFMRRLAERPANVLFLVKNFFRS
ncbi:MAG TPA: proline dehydrogenase family protein [Acidobacteriaceae bacterium]|nr:proline dehydrogenase family protein [Acidobacteriaceae bacterium]